MLTCGYSLGKMQRRQKEKASNDSESTATLVSLITKDSKGKNIKLIERIWSKKSIEILLTLILLVLLSFRVNFNATKNKPISVNQEAALKKENLQQVSRKDEENEKNEEIRSSDSIAIEKDERDFKAIGLKHGTDKVAANTRLKGCLENEETCTRKGCKRLKCRPWGKLKIH